MRVLYSYKLCLPLFPHFSPIHGPLAFVENQMGRMRKHTDKVLDEQQYIDKK